MFLDIFFLKKLNFKLNIYFFYYYQINSKQLTALKSRGKFLPVSKLRSSSIQSIESAESDFNDIMSMRRESTELSS